MDSLTRKRLRKGLDLLFNKHALNSAFIRNRYIL